MRRWVLPVLFGLLTTALVQVHAQTYQAQGTVNLAPSGSQLTAVDPMMFSAYNDVMPARPFLYTVDKNGITITRFNDNQVVGHWPWPKDVIYTVLPNGTFAGLTPPAAWEPVAMVVSYPTESEIANRVKPMPDLTPPLTLVYVVMAHSGYEWQSSAGGYRDMVVPSTNPATESAILIQIDVSDPSFSTALDPVAPVLPHLAGALLGHGAGQPVYDRSTGNVYVGNLPSNSLPTALNSFVSVIRRIPDTVTAEEREVPGINKPVIRCGPQHPEGGIPVGRPQAWACFDPSGTHPIDDNEHVGAAGTFQWEFRNLPTWLTAHRDKVTGELDGILYGTPPAPGEWFAEARVHNLDDEWGAFSAWHPVQLLVLPTAEYLPIRAEFAAGVPVAYQLEGTGSCGLSGAVPAWIDVASVPNGCVVMGRAPLDGEHYNFSMPGFSVAGYPSFPVVFSGDVFGGYKFVPLPNGVGLSGMAWHQISKVADPSTETAVLSLEYIGVEPSTGQLYRILAPPGRPQPPNERPPETALTPHGLSTEGAPLSAALAAARPDIAEVLNTTPLKVRFGEVVVEADRDIFVTASYFYDPEGNDPGIIPIGGNENSRVPDGALMKVSGGTPSAIRLQGVQASSLSLDSDLRTAIIGVEPGQVDHNVLWVSGGTGKAAVVNTANGAVSQTLDVSKPGPLGSVSVDFSTQYAYVADASMQSVAIFGPSIDRPQMKPMIWSYNEISFSVNQPSISPHPFTLMATGDPVPSLTLLGEPPAGLTFTDNHDGTATITGTPSVVGELGYTVVAENANGSYAQAFGVTIYGPGTITSPNTATFIVGSSNSFTVTVDPVSAIIYTWDEALMPPGIELLDGENGTASLSGVPTEVGEYTFTIGADTSYPVDATQVFTLYVKDPSELTEAQKVPVITSPNTFTWEVIGAPFSPDTVRVTSIGSPTPALAVVAGTMPPGVTFIDNHDSTATFGAGCVVVWRGMEPSCLGILPDAAEGTWTFTIRATNSAGYADQVYTLVVERNTTIMTASQTTMSFVYTTGGTLPEPQIVDISTGEGGDTLWYAVETTAPWLSATPIGGTVPTTLTVSANPAGLAAGTYTGTVFITSAGTEGPYATVEVTLTVSSVPLVTVEPGILSFEYIVVDKMAPPAQTLDVTSGGFPVNYKVSTSAPWLVATPTAGTTPATVSISVNPAVVGTGTYTGTITITSPKAGNGPQTATVMMVKAATNKAFFYPVTESMTNVGASPEGMAVNLRTHHLFITSSNAAAETGGEVGGESGAAETETAGPPEPSSVFHVNPINKTVVASIPVHSEGEYAAVNSKTGRVYHASQGSGEVAVLDQATNTPITFIPMIEKPGVYDKVYQPYQIAVDEKQNLIYVGAKAPDMPDPTRDASGKLPCKATHEMPDDEYDCWNPGVVFVIDGKTNQVVSFFSAGDDPEGVVFAADTGKVYASNEDDGSVTVAKGAIRNKNGSITPPKVLNTIIRGKPVSGWWQPTCDANNYCGERGDAALWPNRSACYLIDDEAEEADKMTVDPHGNVYIIDDRYRVAKINGRTDAVVNVLDIPGYQCEAENSSNTLFRNTANNIGFMALDHRRAKLRNNELAWRLFVTSEQNTFTVIDPFSMTIKQTLAVPQAGELDAIKADPKLDRVYVTDEDKTLLWILKGKCDKGGNAACIK